MKSTLRNMVLSLGGLTAIAAAALAGVNLLTREPIEAARKAALREALEAVLPPFDNDITPDTIAPGIVAYKASLGDDYAGTAVESFSDNGFSGRISVLFGFDAEGAVTGYRVLTHSETPGLGAKATDWFAAEGTGHDIRGSRKPLRVKADGGDIDAITGATITSRAFLEALRSARKGLKKDEK